MKRSFITILPLCLAGFSFNACQNDHTSLPDYPVYIERNLSLDALELRTMGNGMEITLDNKKQREYVGFGGILLFHGFDDQIYAFDMACPYELKRTATVHLNDTLPPGHVQCNTCGSIFNVGYGSGSRLEGPANEGLRPYQISLSATSLRVFR